jgi:hypothetical protein
VYYHGQMPAMYLCYFLICITKFITKCIAGPIKHLCLSEENVSGQYPDQDSGGKLVEEEPAVGNIRFF